MYWEDVKVKTGETVSGLADAYGYSPSQWEKIWGHPKNLDVVAKRGRPRGLRAGDVLMVPIPWRVASRTLTTAAHGANLTVRRDGRKGKRLRWVQTVNQDNQPIGATNQFCVDACPPDDADPFYYTNGELTTGMGLPDGTTGDSGRRKKFFDGASRGAPAAGRTAWRAILSIGVVTATRVSVFNSIVWGFNMTSAGAVTKVGPRWAKSSEIKGHLALLRKGASTAAGSFGARGWTFRALPRELGDFPTPSMTVRYG